MSLGALAMQYLPVGLAVVLPLSVAWYGWRGLSLASRAAGAFKMALGVMVGVGVEALRRSLGISVADAGSMLLDVVTLGFDLVSGVVS